VFIYLFREYLGILYVSLRLASFQTMVLRFYLFYKLLSSLGRDVIKLFAIFRAMFCSQSICLPAPCIGPQPQGLSRYPLYTRECLVVYDHYYIKDVSSSLSSTCKWLFSSTFLGPRPLNSFVPRAPATVYRCPRLTGCPLQCVIILCLPLLLHCACSLVYIIGVRTGGWCIWCTLRCWFF